MLMKQLSKGPTMLTDPFKAKTKIFTFCENMRRFEICVILTHRVTPCHTDVVRRIAAAFLRAHVPMLVYYLRSSA